MITIDDDVDIVVNARGTAKVEIERPAASDRPAGRRNVPHAGEHTGRPCDGTEPVASDRLLTGARLEGSDPVVLPLDVGGSVASVIDHQARLELGVRLPGGRLAAQQIPKRQVPPQHRDRVRRHDVKMDGVAAAGEEAAVWQAVLAVIHEADRGQVGEGGPVQRPVDRAGHHVQGRLGVQAAHRGAADVMDLQQAAGRALERVAPCCEQLATDTSVALAPRVIDRYQPDGLVLVGRARYRSTHEAPRRDAERASALS
ncbi:MAG: hypothetical protein U5J97_08295 [Trueperaceae bacterium]|nr:hypothetical protein [Trueperaceae bacterium]